MAGSVSAMTAVTCVYPLTSACIRMQVAGAIETKLGNTYPFEGHIIPLVGFSFDMLFKSSSPHSLWTALILFNLVLSSCIEGISMNFVKFGLKLANWQFNNSSFFPL